MKYYHCVCMGMGGEWVGVGGMHVLWRVCGRQLLSWCFSFDYRFQGLKSGPGACVPRVFYSLAHLAIPSWN